MRRFLGSLKRQQYSGGSEEEGVKKPLNAFLGELFIGSFQDPNATGDTRMISEQVSHHPPVTASHIWNTNAGVRAEGYAGQTITISKPSFNVTIEQVGHTIIYYDDFQEAFLVTLPVLTVKGLLSGTPYPELQGSSYITSSKGFTSKIDYEGKGMFGGGTKNGFTASLYQTSKPENVLFEADGAWNDKFSFYDMRNGDRKEIETYDTAAIQPVPLQLNSLEEQDPWESRRAWADVIAGIKANNWEKTSTAKNKLEEAQRELRRQREQRGEEWVPAFFRSIKEDPVYETLAKGIGWTEDEAKTMGIWKFDLEKAGEKSSPYHGDVKPNLS